MIKEIRFQNYRCFEDSTIQFKDINVVVGKNNSGKSTVIEALRILSIVRSKYRNAIYQLPLAAYGLGAMEKGIKLSVNNLKIDLRGIIHFYRDGIAKITAKFTGGVKIIVSMNKEVVFANIYDKEGRIINSKSKARQMYMEPISIMPPLGLIREQEKLLSDDTIKNDLETYLSSKHFRNELLFFKDEYFEIFRELAEQTWKGLRIKDIEYDISRNEFIQLMVQDAGFPAEIGLMGSGLQMWLQIIWFICRVENEGTVILDEPDVYMHPDLQRKVLNIVKKKCKQVIIATHSVEIISEVEPKNIIKIDKASRRMKFANNLKGVQNIVDNIGSVQNLSLIRLGDAGKCLFVEGKDIKFLSKFCNIIYANSDISIQSIPWIALGGWSRFDEALGTARLFNDETEGLISTMCVLDRDYHLEDEILKMKNRANESNLDLFIWSKKEIESYVLVPEAIFRLTKLPNAEYNKFYELLLIEFDSFKNRVTDNFAQSIKELIPSKSISTCNEEARTIVSNKWETLEGRLSMVNAKEAISTINKFMRERYKVSCSQAKIISVLKKEEIHEDIKAVIDLLIS